MWITEYCSNFFTWSECTRILISEMLLERSSFRERQPVARFYWYFCTSSGKIGWSRDSDRLQNWASLIPRLSKPSNISCMLSPFPTHDKVKTFRIWCIPCCHHGPNFTSGWKSPLLAKIMIVMLAADKILLYHYAQLKSTILHTCQLYRYHERPKDGKWRH